MDAFIRYLRGDTLVLGVNDAVSASAGGSVDLFLDTSKTHAGQEYVILGSTSGTSPGIPVGGLVLPLNFDMFTNLVIAYINSPYLVDFHGNLNAEGRGMATLNTPAGLDPGMAGVELFFAYFLMNPEDLASNPGIISVAN
jgi:hypothetical protein